MIRNMEKKLNEYKILCDKKGSRFGDFYQSDIVAIMERNKNSTSPLPISILEALEVGFMIGYNARKRES